MNIAARLEALAPPGGIVVSGSAQEQVAGKLGVALADRGRHKVKNIARPVRAWKVLGEGERASWRARPRLVAVLAAAVVVIGAFGAWQGGLFGTPELAEDPLLAMPTGPVVAVLPFDNLSGDAEQDYFSDGLTEDLITELAQVSDIRVLARHTTFQYKGQAVDVQEVGRALGADYVVEGSVRRFEDRLRINAQLVTVADGTHAWAERYDRPFADVFAIQDELVARIVANVAGSYGAIHVTELERASQASEDHVRAYDLVLAARYKGYKFGREYYESAKALLKEAMAMAPDYGMAKQEYAYTTLIGWIARLERSMAEPPPELKAAAIEAAAMDPSDARANRTAAMGYFFDHQLDMFEHHADRAMALAPYDAEIFASMGMMLAFTGQWERGVALAEKGYALNTYAAGGWYHTTKFFELYLAGEYRESIEVIRQAPVQDWAETLVKYVMAYGMLGDRERAMEYWNRILELEPDFTAATMIEIYGLWNFRPQNTERIMEGVYAAGIPRPDAPETY